MLKSYIFAFSLFILIGGGLTLTTISTILFTKYSEFSQRICCGNTYYCNATYDCNEINGTFTLEYNGINSTFQCSEKCITSCDTNYNCIFYKDNIYPLKHTCQCPYEIYFVYAGISLVSGILCLLMASIILCHPDLIERWIKKLYKKDLNSFSYNKLMNL